MTAAMVADYYGETNNAINYGSIYAFKALGGSFAGGVAALIMTGTLYGNPSFHWIRGFFFGAALGALAALTVTFLCKPPTEGQMERRGAQGRGEGGGSEPSRPSPDRPDMAAGEARAAVPCRGRGKVKFRPAIMG